MKKPLFSIIVPAYNASYYIEKCIRSILNQTFDDYELIIVDDGSIDDTLKLCENFERKNQKVKVFHQTNKGVVFARAKGVKESKGEYLLFCDSDDMIHKDTLKLIKNVIHKTKSDVITFKMTNNLEQLKEVNDGRYYNKNELEKYIFPYLLEDENGKYFKPSICGGAYKRSLYISNQVDNVKIEIGEDLACMKSMLFNAYSLYEMNDILYYYNNNTESATRSKKVFLWNGPELIGRHIESKIDINSFDMQQQLYRVITHQLFLVVKSQFNKKENYKKIRENILKKLDNDYYINAINQCTYSMSYIKGNLARLSLKKKWILLIFIFSKIC